MRRRPDIRAGGNHAQLRFVDYTEERTDKDHHMKFRRRSASWRFGIVAGPLLLLGAGIGLLSLNLSAWPGLGAQAPHAPVASSGPTGNGARHGVTRPAPAAKPTAGSSKPGAMVVDPAGRGGPPHSKPRSGSPIKHIVILIKENHSFDNLFGRMRGVDGATTARVGSATIRIPLTPDRLVQDIGHTATDSLAAVDQGKMDGFNKQQWAIQNKRDVADTQFSQSQIPDYYRYASTYALADRFFSTILGSSFPNHLVLISGQNAGAIDNPNRYHKGAQAWGCDSSRVTRVPVQSSGKTSSVFPCFNQQTLADEANAAHLRWKYYAAPVTDIGYLWSSFDAIKHVRYSRQWTTNVVDTTRFESDIKNSKLPPLSWVTPYFGESDHPPNSMCTGQNWTVEQINSIMQSGYWKSTAIVLLWDDYGGFYDHVSPPKLSQPFMLGPRVPLILISPYSRRHYVSNTQYDFRSVVKFVEDTFHLPIKASFDRSVNSIANMMNLKQTPAKPMVLQPSQCPTSPPGAVAKAPIPQNY